VNRSLCRVSVCLATFNGSAFIDQHLASILAQLGPDDELIVSDDASTDSTCECVEALRDPRIRLYRSHYRRGHSKNFARALGIATGDLIFLCDQEDVWHPDKLAAVKDVFARHAEVSMVHHGRVLTDMEGLPIGEGVEFGAGIRQGAAFIGSEFLRAPLWGCCMALRAEAVRQMLPFPRGVHTHHHWATAVAALGGGIYLLPEPLISHRQHGANAASKKRPPITRHWSVRLRLLTMLASAWWRTHYRRNASERETERG
jgi:glycosyltransferase involved in cell wall biosynthesis